MKARAHRVHAPSPADRSRRQAGPSRAGQRAPQADPQLDGYPCSNSAARRPLPSASDAKTRPRGVFSLMKGTGRSSGAISPYERPHPPL
jgi:hypothetical protein